MSETEEGKDYEKRVSDVLSKSSPVTTALQECTKDTKSPFTLNFVFVIGPDGTTQRVLASPEQALSMCVATKIKGIKLPAPPKADWLVSVNISIGEASRLPSLSDQ